MHENIIVFYQKLLQQYLFQHAIKATKNVDYMYSVSI